MTNTMKHRYGPWAVVTGASAGMGAEFARQLAADGIHLVLVARRAEQLAERKVELEAEYGVQVRTLALDLSRPDALEILAQHTRDLEIGLLVNNAAMVQGGSLVQTDVEAQTDLLQVNVVNPVRLTHHFAGLMCQRGRGGVVFVASVGAYASVPYMANYMATKAYLVSMGEALRTELKPRGVDVIVLSPGGTDTHPGEVMPPPPGFESDDFMKDLMPMAPVVQQTLSSLGCRGSVVPGLMTQVMVFVLGTLLPRPWAARLFGSQLRPALKPEFV